MLNLLILNRLLSSSLSANMAKVLLFTVCFLEIFIPSISKYLAQISQKMEQFF